jgi:hypothetical protein
MDPKNNVSDTQNEVPQGAYLFQQNPKDPDSYLMIRIDKTYPFDYKKGEVEKPTLNGGEEYTFFG